MNRRHHNRASYGTAEAIRDSFEVLVKAIALFLFLGLAWTGGDVNTLVESVTGVSPLAAPVMPDQHFSGCNDARAAGRSNIPSSDPSYRSFMDGDGDGLACERR